MEISKCRECGSKDIAITDCGYSSFNFGKATCKGCGFIVNVSNCSCFPHDEIVSVWNLRNSKKGKAADKLREQASSLISKAKRLDEEAMVDVVKQFPK